MKEWLIRIGCVLLGVVLTLGTMHLTDLIKSFNNDTVSVEAEIDEDASKEVVNSTDESKEDYDLEAKLKYQDMVDKLKEETSKDKTEQQDKEPEEAKQEDVAPGSIESAPVKWIKDYPSVNSDSTIEDKLSQRSSYDETMAVNAFDRMVISEILMKVSENYITGLRS